MGRMDGQVDSFIFWIGTDDQNHTVGWSVEQRGWFVISLKGKNGPGTHALICIAMGTYVPTRTHMHEYPYTCTHTRTHTYTYP